MILKYGIFCKVKYDEDGICFKWYKSGIRIYVNRLDYNILYFIIFLNYDI